MTDQSKTAEQLLINGNLASLTEDQRVTYYMDTCESLGLNYRTKPFDYITLNGKLTLYARKDATDQIRKIHKVSIVKLEKEFKDGLYICTAYAEDGQGRQDVSTGALSILNLKGEALANAIMKCESKAKRRVTLSICGLGMLDETEVDSIPELSKKPIALVEEKNIDVIAPVFIDSEMMSYAEADIDRCKTMAELKKTFMDYYNSWVSNKDAIKRLSEFKDAAKAKIEADLIKEFTDVFDRKD